MLYIILLFLTTKKVMRKNLHSYINILQKHNHIHSLYIRKYIDFNSTTLFSKVHRVITLPWRWELLKIDTMNFKEVLTVFFNASAVIYRKPEKTRKVIHRSYYIRKYLDACLSKTFLKQRCMNIIFIMLNNICILHNSCRYNHNRRNVLSQVPIS